ncbi:MAG: class I SAM-dependent rRNA methyltransferase [Deltaproteobacteria bacterium]|nr:class I SAM-dependent rRNA methyltransferase [Deltaproteobacteria bacterium]
MPALVLGPKARVFRGHVWVYASEVIRTEGDPGPGDAVELLDKKGRFAGVALYNPASQLVARRVSRRRVTVDHAFFVERLQQALRVRAGFPDPVYRVAFSEADGLPGAVVDRYGDVVVLQTLTFAMDQRQDLLVDAIQAVLSPRTIVERNDASVRKLEGLALRTGVLRGPEPAPFEVSVHGVRQVVDVLQGQKTGLYLDQLDAYPRVARYAAGKRVLDCFSNQGGFALHAARVGARQVIAVDQSAGAVQSILHNAKLNGVEIEAVEANAFDYLKAEEQARSGFDLVVLDPPSFTRSKKSVQDALRGYKEIHLRAMRLLAPGGVLATFSCSHHVSREAFWQVIADAAVDARRTLRLVESHDQRADHPVVAGLPETEYLKGFTLEVMAD